MKKSCNNEFINEYEKIRLILRDFFLYGCFSRDDFKSKNISPRKYDNEKKKILTFLNNNYITELVSNKKKYIKMNYNMFHFTSNYLSDSYRVKNFTNTDVELYLKIMQILNEKNEQIDQNQILKSLDFHINQLDSEKNPYEELSIYRKLKELIGIGIIKSEKKGKKFYYSIESDIFQNINEKEIKNLYYAVNYFSKVLYPCLPGQYLLETLKQYIVSEKNDIIKDEDFFMFKHNHFQHVLDDEIIWKLILIIKNRSMVSFEYRTFGNYEWTKKSDIIPIKIIADEYYGRRFLFAIDKTTIEPKIYRIDRIRSIKENKDKKVDINIEDIYKEYMIYSWCSVPLNKEKGLFKVELIFKFNNYNEKYMVERIKKEGKWGIIEKIKEYTYKYSINVTDPTEMKPWIRTFTGCIEILENSNHNLKDEFNKEWNESRSIYGIV